MAAKIPVSNPKASSPEHAGNSASYAFNPSSISACPLTFPTQLQRLWKPVLQTPCAFAACHFLLAMENLLRNPNLTSSCLYRAEIYYDSDQDAALGGNLTASGGGGLVAHLRQDVQPRGFECVPQGWSLNRAVVRNLVPRNPSLDPFLVQTVLFAGRKSEGRQETLVIYVPHVDKADDVPFYHPRVSAAAVLHSSAGLDDSATPATRPPGTLSVLYRLFSPAADAMSEDLPSRLQRTALNLLRISHKHSTGRATGYQKRVHHDAVIPQARFQDTYSRLKARYARDLMDAWAEVTDPAKHVFEDLGIAAFLIELWRDMYGEGGAGGGSRWRLGRGVARLKKGGGGKSKFPGFVDIGCGNGVLVFLLLSEGYDGWGFDVRKRKSWSVFPENVQARLQEMQLVPEVLARHAVDEVDALRVDSKSRKEGGIHNGIFPEGTFIISNHADQLTPWTPLMAYASNCPFIAIPCCSHALSGKLQRFYDIHPATLSSASNSSSIDTTDNDYSNTEAGSDVSRNKTTDTAGGNLETEPAMAESEPYASGPGPATGILTPRPKNQPSAYAGFTAHVMRLAERVGYAVESERLRIPSTRNLCVIGRGFSDADGATSFGSQTRDKDSDGDGDESGEGDRLQVVEELVQEDVGDLDKAARDWVKEVRGLAKPGVGGH